jgi:glycerol-1-phosphate dehydrogenase [NAD(P)+]
LSPPSAPDTAVDLAALRSQLGAAELRPLGLGGVLLGRGVLHDVADVVGELRRSDGDVVLVADRHPMAGDEGEVKQGIVARLRGAGLPVRRVTIGEHDEAHADAATLAAAAAASGGTSVLLSVGSGTVADIGKALSLRLGGVPHVAVQTAASVNGFSDNQSVLLVDGVRCRTATRWPERVLIDTDVVARAPVELNRAGVGDLLATYIAPADWLLARLVGQDDSYSAAVAGLGRAHADVVLRSGDRIHRGDADAVGHLAAALTLSGIAMGVAGSTAPGSGMEHAVGRLLERSGAPHLLHGATAGALSVLAAMLWARVRAVARGGGLRALRFPSAAAMEPRVRAAFAALDPSGQMGEECWRGYARKLERWHAARDELTLTLADRWPAFDAELDGLLASPERLVEALRAARAPVRLSELGVADAAARWALAHAHLTRDRFTVADLAFFMGVWNPGDVDALLIDAARLGAGV